MATSPTTSALGALGDLGRPVAAKAPARAGDTAEKSSFSAVFHDAQGSRPEPQQRPAADKTDAPQSHRDNEKQAVARTRTAALSGNKSVAPAATGKDLPPAGESLPATLDQLLTNMAADKEAGASSGKDASSEDSHADADSACVPDPLAAIPGFAAVVPENSVTAAATALASRSGQVVGDDGQPSAAIGEVTSSQKREIPAAAQTLNTAAALPGEIATADTLPADAAATDLLASAKPSVEKPAADKKSAETSATDKTSAAIALPGVATGAIPATATAVGDIAAADSSEQGMALDKMQVEKNAGSKTTGDGSGDNKNSAALVGDGTVSDAALSAVADQPVETERGRFRDTLKQLDSTLAPSTARSDNAPVAAARDSGLRQYLDSSATATKVDVPVGKAGWSDAVAGKVMWMSSQNLSSAEIQMNPADLGPLSVRVSSHQDQTSIFFTSPHAAVREALDQSLPRLREMMGNQGIQLQDVGVGGQGSMREQRAFSDSGGGGSRGRGARDAEIDTEIGSVTRTTTTLSRPGLLDAYA